MQKPTPDFDVLDMDDKKAFTISMDSIYTLTLPMALSEKEAAISIELKDLDGRSMSSLEYSSYIDIGFCKYCKHKLVYNNQECECGHVQNFITNPVDSRTDSMATPDIMTEANGGATVRKQHGAGKDIGWRCTGDSPFESLDTPVTDNRKLGVACVFTFV